MINFISEIHIANKDHYVNAFALLKFARWNLLITKFILVVLLATGLIAIINPVPIYLITGNLEPMLPVQMPFVRLDTKSGYMIHSICIFLLLVSGIFGTFASELFLITLTIQIAPMAKIFDNAINSLNEVIGGNRQESIKTSTWLHENIRNLALIHKEIYL